MRSAFLLKLRFLKIRLLVTRLKCLILALSYLLHFLSLHKSLVYPPSVYILYDECSENVTGESSSVKYQWRNWGPLGVIAPPSRKKLLYLKKCKNEIFHLFLPHFNFWQAAENVTTCPFWRVAKIIHNESFFCVFFHEHSRFT